ncbi:hypothetical protein ASPFODRAFT_201759 [Aspergillus luchuensis CBS 106.47]|uniref:Protein kinase domain-containing protein n=1 Tax=Aspergillus luchuensis (strain CBS 106.47) TaxID=1137211 RepID=A0A1M3TYP8_ASPLC|nr:hypothetical protein ASPFODRAFT_201759 [Aspergillus luchuensis CBS 106.47]
MDPVSLALSIFGTLDICLGYGKRLVELCRAIRNLKNDLAQIALVIEGVWLKTEVQLDILRRLLRAGSLDHTLASHYGDALQRLDMKISGAVAGLEAVQKRSISSSKFPQAAWTVYLKRHLEEVVSDLEEWQRRFDPSWYLITFIVNPLVDEQLESKKNQDPSAAKLLEFREAVQQISSAKPPTNGPVFKDPALLEPGQHISGTSNYLSQYVNSRREVLLDSTSYTRKSALTSRVHVRDLARLLCLVDPSTFSLLKCDGVIEVRTDQDTQFQFIFEVPHGLQSPRTLRSLLAEHPRISLSKRVQLAKQLARSVMFVHTTGFVHKGIRPETIMIFRKDNEDIGPSFLVGFERVRRAEAQTDKLGDLEWERNLYRHPVRQGLWSEEAFTMQHDIYSLGVCLLEMALWNSFVRNDSIGTTTPWSELAIQDAIADKDARRGGFAMKRKLVAMAKDRLPAMVGDQYTNIVLACLCCLDGVDDNIFRDVKDDDDIVIGVRFIENVLVKLEELHI